MITHPRTGGTAARLGTRIMASTTDLTATAELEPAKPTQSDLGFDPNALSKKYRAERDKRLRADGNEQYQEINGEFAHYLDDPYVEPGFARAPLTDEVEVVVIGGGFGGLLAGARLREAGVQDIRIISTNRGDAMKARHVVMANGPLHRPKLPGIPGVETFRGHSFHTSRWDYAYTGGDSNGGLTGLKDKRVGIIGTGATAVQCVPHVGAAAKQLYVFQRTPSSIDVRANRPTDPQWAQGLQPGWQQHRMDNFNALGSGGFAEEDLVNDGWTDIIADLLLLMRKDSQAGKSPEDLAKTMQLAY